MAPEDKLSVDALRNTLATYSIEGYVAENDPKYGDLITEKIRQNIEFSDIVLALYTKAGGSSTFVNQEIAWGMAKGKKCIIMKEPGVTQNGFIYGTEVIEYNPLNPNEAISRFVKFVIPLKESKAQWDGIVKAGLLMAGGVVLYNLLKGDDEDEDE